ncbi:uncharacterized protein G2W53_025485 [Senna tora]|uniref:Uncharacterized protein n=1 Tax=Senna tora TaxID=362788 RepID=A0A834TFT5_9FABA|nr:uncharacterized protein G2W53_025485 [Senna tora]
MEDLDKKEQLCVPEEVEGV